jgi:limonene-1,2-epoxide hydrolase
MSTNAEQIVRAFLGAWPRRDVDQLMSYFAPDAVYHNIPVAPLVGTAAIRGAFQGFYDMMTEGIELDVLHVVGNGDVVMAERIDRFRWDGKRLDLPVCGVFEVRNGKIVKFRDYFNYPSWFEATGAPL